MPRFRSLVSGVASACVLASNAGAAPVHARARALEERPATRSATRRHSDDEQAVEQPDKRHGKERSRPGTKLARAPELAKSAPATPVKARENPYLEVPDRAFAERTLAYHYANLSDEDALAELRQRGIAWEPATPPFPGVRSPVRLAGPLHGVSVHASIPEAERATSSLEILDARLALALDDFCALLARHDIVELVHYDMYRPPGERSPGAAPPIRHPAGLAIDVGAFRKRDGTWLRVKPSWPSDVGAKTCGGGAVEQWSRDARELASIVCEAADERLFHFELTPDCNTAHADHLHLEIRPGAHSFIFN